MNFHHWLFKILKKNQNVKDGRTERRTDGQRENSIPPRKLCLRGGIIKKKRPKNNGVDLLEEEKTKTKKKKTHDKCSVWKQLLFI